MSLQTDNLAMIALGVAGDQPVSPLQPVLPNGIHLRWAFARDLGFPWHGFHLFRRPARAGSPLCLSAVTGGLKPGLLAPTHHTAIGRLSSDLPLAVTDEFAPTAQAELALEGRGFVRFDLPAGELARRVELRIGFRATCLDAQALGEIPTPFPPSLKSLIRLNPLSAQGLTFTVKDANGQPAAQTAFTSVNTTQGPLVGLGCGYGLTILLSTPGNTVQLLVTHTLSTAKIEAYDAANQKVASTFTQAPAGQPETIDLNGPGIVRVEVRTLRDTAFLHRICFPTGGGRREVAGGVKVTAFSGGTQVRVVTVSGQPGQVVAATLRYDAITAVEVGPGLAALVDLCYVPVAQEATEGWKAIDGFPYPLGLPVTEADYPCSVSAPASLLPQRVRYPLPPEWGAGSFAELHQQLVEMVSGGPTDAPMAERLFAAPELEPNPPAPDPPQLSTLYILDLLLLASIHPALAQLVGLYWVDATAVAGTAYDYLVVADHAGVGERSAQKTLKEIQGSGFARLDGFIVFDQRAQAAPPLPPPGAPEAYELPGGFFPDAEGSLPQWPNMAGLRWDAGWDASGTLLPERAVAYLVWRAGLGDGPAPGAGGSPSLLTKLPAGQPKPVMVAEARLPAGSVPQRPPGWPALPLHYIDRGLPDGWYGWRVSGIDLFGRHSANGPQAVLRLLDRVPPPIPTGVEAYVLDPRDPHLQRDNAYKAWNAGFDLVMGKTLVGLRVRWRWTPAHQRQAPDTVEFRIYLHPGAVPPAGRDQGIHWQHRWFVVPYASSVTVEALTGDRVYEVFLPAPPGPGALPPLPLNPSLAEPVVYAHVGVSAADGKPHTADARTTGAFANRAGNEGSVGAPAKIYRVLRDLPPAPAALLNDARYYASPADYHDRSFFTYRWKPEPNLKLHVFRALDDAVFQADWARRPAAQQLSASQASLFPAGWNQAGRQQVADALNHLDTLVPPTGASEEDADAARAKAMAYYGQLSDAALRVLAGLPTSEGAFVQLTIEPLDPNHAANANRLGPDDPDGFVVDTSVRAFVDTLDGRGTNRYFYRAALVDGAHNLGALGPSSPPVYLPNVVPPRAPVITKVLGGDRQITLKWASNREPDLAEYRVYRTDREEATRDLRLMELVHTEPVPPGDPAARPAEVVWDDTPVPGLINFYYCVIAIDDAENVSTPSLVVTGRAFDDARPDAPTWNPPVPGNLPGEITLSWSSLTPDLRCMIQRRLAGETPWENLSPWLPRGTYDFTDGDRDASLQYNYRLRVMDVGGKTNNAYNELTV